MPGLLAFTSIRLPTAPFFPENASRTGSGLGFIVHSLFVAVSNKHAKRGRIYANCRKNVKSRRAEKHYEMGKLAAKSHR
jgi:hypothetical protein